MVSKYEKKDCRQQSANNLTGSYVSVLYERSLAAIQNGWYGIIGLAEFDGQLRFYYLQKSQIRKGKASDNLSGLYAGPHLGYRWTYEYFNHRRNKLLREPIAGLTAGYQQRLFNKLYFDSALSMSAIGFFKAYSRSDTAS